jgi:hypothetical protein
MGQFSDIVCAVLARRRVALVGVAKNCGKTTTLNYLLRSIPDTHPTGLLSIGIDGEARDALIGTAKPTITVDEGRWVVTARHALTSSDASVEYVESLGIDTPLGEVFLARVLSRGQVILAGIRHRRDLELALSRLEAHGVALTLIDGAYGRVMGAHGDVAEAVVFSTGAVVAETPEKISSRTEELVSRWELPAVTDAALEALIGKAMDEQQCLLLDRDGSFAALPAASALIGLGKARHLWKPTTDAIAIPGLVSDRVVEELLAIGPTRRTLVLPCPTAIHVEEALWRRFRRRWDVCVLRSSVILGISFNPTSIQGYRVNEEALRIALEKRWPSVPIFDPMSAP